MTIRESPVNKSKGKNSSMERFINANVRAMKGEGNERKYELSFSSEEPYCRYFGMEILDHTESCVDLERLNTIGVLLFNHDTDKVIGKVTKAWIENNRGIAIVEFDDDDFAEKIQKKVESGTLKGVSVRYIVDIWEDVMPGKKSSDGRFKGPCSIAKKWTPLEISIVPVPADPTVGVGRSEEGMLQTGDNLSYYSRIALVNKNKLKGGMLGDKP